MKKTLIRALFVFFALFSVSQWLFGAEITVPRLEFASRGASEDGDFTISTSAEADIAVNGGYKYGITLGLGFEAQNLEKALSYGRLELPYALSDPTKDEYNAMVDELNDRHSNQAVLSVRLLEATAREVFGKPLDLSFFAGHYHALGSGDEFVSRFGTAPVGSSYRDFFYFPDGIGNDSSRRYNGGIYSIFGTGVAAALNLSDNVVSSFYAYQDLSYRHLYPGEQQGGCFSGDFRLLVNSEKIKLEFFSGGSYLRDKAPAFHGGVLALFSSGAGFDFLVQGGIPFWRYGEGISIDNCYFLMEPRLRIGKAGLHITLFYRPVYYQNIEETDEQGRTDINVKLFFGDINKTFFEWGLESTVKLQIRTGEDISMWVSPFISVITSGLQWDFKVRVNPLYFAEGGNIAEAFIGIRTAY
ncbi:MAG: hypothetical protein LBP29_06750 [Treponema sp.]|jgi:hypothetical protein|nr:hypothetical protein [Treponema sp.]